MAKKTRQEPKTMDKKYPCMTGDGDNLEIFTIKPGELFFSVGNQVIYQTGVWLNREQLMQLRDDITTVLLMDDGEA